MRTAVRPRLIWNDPNEIQPAIAKRSSTPRLCQSQSGTTPVSNRKPRWWPRSGSPLVQVPAAERPGGSWIEYKWYKATRIAGAPQLSHAEEVSRKVSYMLQVKGQPFQVGAGIYNDTATVAELDAMLKN